MKTKLLSILMVLFCLFDSNKAYATESTKSVDTDKPAIVYIESIYSSNITPLEGDVFEIIYGIRGEKGLDNTATITVDASKIIGDNAVTIEMTHGSYEIKRITYVGTNKGRNCYGVEIYFNVTYSGDDSIILTVGYETTKAKDKELADFIGVGLITDAYFMQQVTERPKITFEALEAEIIETETEENNSNNLELIPSSDSDNYIIEIHGKLYDSSKESSTKSNNVNTIMIVCICVIILTGVILIIKKKNTKQ